MTLWNRITLRKFWIAQTCLHDILEPIRWRYKFCCEAEKWWVFWTVQQQHCYLWKNSAKWTALTLGKISTKLMRSGAIWRYLWIKKFATWRKIPEPGNTLKDEALFTAKFQNKSTQPYDATNENLVFGKSFFRPWSSMSVTENNCQLFCFLSSRACYFKKYQKNSRCSGPYVHFLSTRITTFFTYKIHPIPITKINPDMTARNM